METIKSLLKNKLNIYAYEWMQDLDPISKQHLESILSLLHDQGSYEEGYDIGYNEGYDQGVDDGYWDGQADCECECDD